MMNNKVIRLDVTHAAFQNLADTAEGHQALEELNQAYAAFKKKVKPDLNDYEFKYLLDHLVLQREIGSFRWHVNS